MICRHGRRLCKAIFDFVVPLCSLVMLGAFKTCIFTRLTRSASLIISPFALIHLSWPLGDHPTNTRAHTHARQHTQTHNACTHKLADASTHAHTYTHLHIYTPTHLHLHICTHTRTRTQTCLCQGHVPRLPDLVINSNIAKTLAISALS